MMLSSTHTVALVALIGMPLAAQQRDSPTFEVASVRLNTSGEAGGSIDRQGNQIVIRNRTLRDIILNAYRLQRYQLVGGVDWINTTRFDVIAKEPEGVPGNLRMMQALLVDRFKLRVHNETRQMPVYALVQGTDKRLGPQLQVAAPDSKRSGNAVPGRIRFRAYSTADLAGNLSNWAGRLVVDSCEVRLTWARGAPCDPAVDGQQQVVEVEVRDRSRQQLCDSAASIED